MFVASVYPTDCACAISPVNDGTFMLVQVAICTAILKPPGRKVKSSDNFYSLTTILEMALLILITFSTDIFKFTRHDFAGNYCIFVCRSKFYNI